jgi:hypothetical protein
MAGAECKERSGGVSDDVRLCVRVELSFFVVSVNISWSGSKRKNVVGVCDEIRL